MVFSYILDIWASYVINFGSYLYLFQKMKGEDLYYFQVGVEVQFPQLVSFDSQEKSEPLLLGGPEISLIPTWFPLPTLNPGIIALR